MLFYDQKKRICYHFTLNPLIIKAYKYTKSIYIWAQIIEIHFYGKGIRN